MIAKPNDRLSVGNFIHGEWIKGSGTEFEIESPYFGDHIGLSHHSTSADIAKAVESGNKAFALWRHTPLKERCKVMFSFRDILLDRMDEISNIISLENGKTLGESKAGLMKGIEVLEFASAAQNLDGGAKMQVSRGVHCEYRREPLGVVASITPFNFPAMVPMWTIPIAIVMGNAYIWKPSEKTPCTSIYIAQAFKDAGLPDGVLNVIQGGKDSVLDLVKHPDVKAVSFVGSSAVAEKVYHEGCLSGKRVLALGGAKNHIILLPDAQPEIAGRGISDSFTGCAGQRCMAASVLLAVGNPDKQIEEIIARSKEQVLGETMGAIITKAQVDFLSQAIDRAVSQGAKLILDGRTAKKPDNYPKGFWIGPTILDNVDPKNEAANKELFGPILSIVRCKSLSEAIQIENANPYGNACSVFTNNGALAEKVCLEAQSGMVGINIGVPVPREPFSFGGTGHSRFGHGDITGMQGIDFWTQQKKITSKWEEQKDQNWMS